jgi:hypothetical protein
MSACLFRSVVLLCLPVYLEVLFCYVGLPVEKFCVMSTCLCRSVVMLAYLFINVMSAYLFRRVVLCQSVSLEVLYCYVSPSVYKCCVVISTCLFRNVVLLCQPVYLEVCCVSLSL